MKPTAKVLALVALVITSSAFSGCVALRSDGQDGVHENVVPDRQPSNELGNHTVDRSDAAPSGPTRVEPNAPAEYLKFFLPAPPAGTLVLSQGYKGAGREGTFMRGIVVLSPHPVFFAKVSAVATDDYLEVHSQDANASIACCPMERRMDGRGHAQRPVLEGTPWIEIWLIVAGWDPSEEAWFEVFIETDAGQFGVPLVERGSDVQFLDLREDLRHQGTHVIANGVTLVSTSKELSLEIQQPLLGILSVTSAENHLQLNASVNAASRAVRLGPGQNAGGFFASEAGSLHLSLAVDGDPHSFAGLVLTCACRPSSPFEEFNGAWSDRQPP